jgi:hypothetical protein
LKGEGIVEWVLLEAKTGAGDSQFVAGQADNVFELIRGIEKAWVLASTT